MDISVVAPVYNEEDNVAPLYEKLTETLLKLGWQYEIIFVNDGSNDKSWQVISELAKNDSHVKAINLRKNFGQTIALSAGFDHSKGEILITIDADLQNDPSDIPMMIEKLKEGFDVVSGWRKKRKDKFLDRRLPSIIANRIISKVTGAKIHDFGCSLKVYRRQIIENLKLYGDMHRLIGVYVTWLGAKVAEVEVRHHARKSGKSKYGLERTFKVILDLITAKFLISFSTKPSYVFGGIGLCLLFLGLLTAVFILIRAVYFTGVWVSPLIFIMTICLVTSIQFILMGLLGEIAVRTYHESQNKPPYLISEKLNIG